MPRQPISKDQYRDIGDQEIRSQAELKDALANAGGSGSSDRRALAGAGVPYQISDIDIPACPAGILILLESIESPFIQPSEEGKEEAFRASDVMIALFLMANGKAAAGLCMGLAKRREALETTRSLAESSPEFYREYIARLDEITAEQAVVQKCACEWFYDCCPELGIQEAAVGIISVLNDMMEAAAGLPSSSNGDGNGKKKDTI